MKKLTALLLGAAMALSLAACGSTAAVEETASEETSSSEAAGFLVTVKHSGNVSCHGGLFSNYK